jgi:hypothetical protein
MSMAIPGLLLIITGIILMIQVLLPAAERLNTPAMTGVMLTMASLALLARFALNGRRERGLLVISLTLLLLVILSVLVVGGVVRGEQFFPLALMGAGAAIFITFLFERSHERGLVLPALMLMVAGGVALALSALSTSPSGVFNADVQGLAAVFWPVLLLVAVLVVLPLAFRALSDV